MSKVNRVLKNYHCGLFKKVSDARRVYIVIVTVKTWS
jgi:hypothetical protein